MLPLLSAHEPSNRANVAAFLLCLAYKRGGLIGVGGWRIRFIDRNPFRVEGRALLLTGPRVVSGLALDRQHCRVPPSAAFADSGRSDKTTRRYIFGQINDSRFSIDGNGLLEHLPSP